ncbi:MAG TPA: ATP-binding protein [Kofleriaceae bacterium]
MASSRTATIGFGVGLALVAVLGVFAVRSAREAMTAVAWVERSHAVIEAVDATGARLGEAKSLRRAYGVTGTASYKSEYRDAVNAIGASLTNIRTLVSADPTQLQRLSELAPLFEARVARLEQQLVKRDELGKDLPLDDAQALANGKLDDHIRMLTAEMITQERDELTEREASSASTFATAEIVGAASAICALVALALAFAIVQREIRERRRAEAETAAALSASEALNQELEAFSYSVSHDLRSPLRAIDGFSLALLEDSADKLDADGKSHLERVRGATQRMGRLIDDLLELSRVARAPMRLEPIDLSAMAATIVAELRDAEPAREVAVTIAPSLATRGDPRLVRVLLDNLLGNAFKFTGKRKRATIEIGATAGAFFVRDNGAGFDPAYTEKLFGAFQRLHDARDFAGTGIGLATVQRIVRRHGGRVWATGEPDKGATFSFTLG